MRIDEIDEEILLALKDGEKTLKGIGALVKSPRIAKRRIQKLLKYGFVKRIRRGIYGLDSKGKRYTQKQILSDKALFIGEDLWQKVSTFIIDNVPTEVYQAVVRLTLSEMRAKQSELFTNLENQFSAGWSGPLLAGQPKAMKTPVGELICKTQGLDPEEQKFPITGTKSEFGYPYQEGGVWKYRPSPWHKEPIVLIDDWHRIINKDARDTALSIARGNRTFKRYGEKFINQVVPFIALNTHTHTIPETTEKIIKEIGEEDVKRLIVVNVDYLAPYLEDAAILTRKMLRGVPRLNFKAFPIKKKELIDKEFNFMCHLLKESTKEDKRGFFDERSVEILTLGRHALAKNRDIIGTIYQTCWDRLLCLETLEVTKEGWRESFRKKWKEYVSIEQPKVLEEVKKEEKREEERGKKIKKAKERGVQQEAEQLKKRRSFQKSRDSLIAKLKNLRDNLPRKKRWQNKLFPFRKDIERLVDEMEGIRDPQKLEKYRLIYPELEKEQKELLGEIKEIEDKEHKLKEEEEARQDTLKKRKAILKEKIKDCEKLFILWLKKVGAEPKDIQEGKKMFISLSSETEKAKDIESLDPIELKVEDIKKITNNGISSFEEREEKKRQEEEDRNQARKEQNQIQRQVNKLQKEKRKIEEQLNKELFRKNNLPSLERALFETLEGYKERKTVPTNNLTLFFEKLGLIKKMKSWYAIPGLNKGRTFLDVFWQSYFNKFGEVLPYEIYWAADGQVYPLNYFQHWDWDQVKGFIQIRINQLRDKAVKKRKKELSEQWDALDKKERRLKPLLYYIRTDRRLIRVKYWEEKEEQRLHFEFEDGQKRNVPKGKKWTVHTKIDYGGELFPFISKKGSIIVVQTNEGEREISEDQIFCYIYEYKEPEPS